MIAARAALVTGASNGIGRALALTLARPGATLHINGRNRARLEATAAECRARGAAVDARVLDVRDAAGMRDWIGGMAHLDLAIANAGTAALDIFRGPETEADTAAIFATNVDGMLNTVLPAMARMRDQPADAAGLRGRIAALASTAAFAPIPTAPAYCASKSAVDAWVVGRAASARRDGISLTSICPGYVRTYLTSGNDFRMPGLMEPEDAARRILRAVEAGRVRAVFPWWMGLASRLGANLPAGSTARLLGRRCRYVVGGDQLDAAPAPMRTDAPGDLAAALDG